jgi:hypothetical protein
LSSGHETGLEDRDRNSLVGDKPKLDAAKLPKGFGLAEVAPWRRAGSSIA